MLCLQDTLISIDSTQGFKRQRCRGWTEWKQRRVNRGEISKCPWHLFKYFISISLKGKHKAELAPRKGNEIENQVMHWEQFKGSQEAPSAAERAQSSPNKGWVLLFSWYFCLQTPSCIVLSGEEKALQTASVWTPLGRVSPAQTEWFYIYFAKSSGWGARLDPVLQETIQGSKLMFDSVQKRQEPLAGKMGGKKNKDWNIISEKVWNSTLSNSPASSMSTLRGGAVCDVWSGWTFLGKTVWFYWETRFGESCSDSSPNPTIFPSNPHHSPSTPRQALGSASKASNHSSRGENELEKWILG